MTPLEDAFLRSTTACRIATADRRGMPHAVPVRYAWDGEFLYIMTNYGRKKLRNLEKNPHAAVLVDDFGARKGVLVQGQAETVRGGPEFVAGQQVLIAAGCMKRLRQEGEEVLIRIRPVRVASWGLEKE